MRMLGLMIAFLLISLVVRGGLRAPSLRAAGAGPLERLSEEDVYARALRQIDDDHDGRISRAEFLARGSARDFEAADRDGDGYIDLDELIVAVRASVSREGVR